MLYEIVPLPPELPVAKMSDSPLPDSGAEAAPKEVSEGNAATPTAHSNEQGKEETQAAAPPPSDAPKTNPAANEEKKKKQALNGKQCETSEAHEKKPTTEGSARPPSPTSSKPRDDPQSIEYMKQSPRRHRRDPLEPREPAPRELLEREQNWESRLWTDIVETAQAERMAKLHRPKPVAENATPAKQQPSQTIVQARKLASEWLLIKQGGGASPKSPGGKARVTSSLTPHDMPPFVVPPIFGGQFGLLAAPPNRSNKFAATHEARPSPRVQGYKSTPRRGATSVSART